MARLIVRSVPESVGLADKTRIDLDTGDIDCHYSFGDYGLPRVDDTFILRNSNNSMTVRVVNVYLDAEISDDQGGNWHEIKCHGPIIECVFEDSSNGECSLFKLTTKYSSREIKKSLKSYNHLKECKDWTYPVLNNDLESLLSAGLNHCIVFKPVNADEFWCDDGFITNDLVFGKDWFSFGDWVFANKAKCADLKFWNSTSANEIHLLDT